MTLACKFLRAQNSLGLFRGKMDLDTGIIFLEDWKLLSACEKINVFGYEI